MNLLATKSLDTLMAEAGDEEGHGLKRALTATNLVALGIGGIIGAGIFVLTGHAAAQFAGPAIVISFILAGLASAFAGLCYAEFASLIPIAGSAYTYGYATLGEIFAWIIGWDLVLEYAFGAATVAVGWAGNVVSLLQDWHITIPPQLTAGPWSTMVQWHGRWEDLAKVGDAIQKAGVDWHTLPHVGGFINLVAVVGIALVSWILVVGIKESANFNSAVVFLKVILVLVFIATGFAYLVQKAWVPLQTNWHPFIPPRTPDGHYGWSGVFSGAAEVFFAYIGFDAVSTAAQEARNPQRDMPIGILGSLGICTVLYILVSGLLTAIVPYTQLNSPTPIADGMDAMGYAWGSLLVKVGSIAGLGSVMLVLLLGQSRVFYSMAKDGLLWEWAGKIHETFRTPYVSTIVVGTAVALISALFPINDLGDMVSIGTLLAFVIVCAGVWRLRLQQPDLPRAFKTPWVPFVPIMGIGTSLFLMQSLPLVTWIRLVAWLLVGLIIYFRYSTKHSKVQQALDPTLG